MEQEIRFCPVDGRRVAYATVGEGPLLVMPTWWLSHLELDWQLPEMRIFLEHLGQTHRVVRYDRLGAGLSDRDVDFASVTHDHELRTLEALFDHLGEEDCSLLALSCAGTLAAQFAYRHPENVRSLVFYNSYANGEDLATPELGSSIVEALTRADWRVGSRLSRVSSCPAAPRPTSRSVRGRSRPPRAPKRRRASSS